MNILSIPVDAARFASGASLEVAERVFSAVAGGTDRPSNITDTEPARHSIYAIAEPMLDLAGIIYAFVGLRKEAKKRLFDIAKKKNLCDDIDGLSSAGTHLAVLRNAVQCSVAALKQFEKTGDGTAGANFRNYLAEVESLKREFELSDGEVELCKDYFHVLSLPKTVDAVKADFILHNEWMKTFIILFGGVEANLKAIVDCCEKDPSFCIVKVEDEHTTSDGGPFAEELTFAIAVSDKFKGIYVIFSGRVSANDWIANVQANAVDCLLPGFTSSYAKNHEQQNFGKVHEGIYKYLFSQNQTRYLKGGRNHEHCCLVDAGE